MANVVIWVVILFTARCMSQVPSGDIVLDGGVACTSGGATVTLNLANRTPRPTIAIFNGVTNKANCKPDILAGDNPEVTVAFAECDIQTGVDKVTTFKLYIVHQLELLSSVDFLVSIRCSQSDTGTIEKILSGVNEPAVVNKNGESENPLTGVTMAFLDGDDNAILKTDSVDLGATIKLKLTATGAVVFQVEKCTVETTNDRDEAIAPFEIITGWCAVSETPVQNFDNANRVGATGEITSTATISAFRMVGQGATKPLTFKCSIKWCADDAGACKHPADTSTVCTSRRRRRQIADLPERYGAEKTLTSSLHVKLPGIVASGTTTMAGNDYIVKLAVLLFCGLRYIMY